MYATNLQAAEQRARDALMARGWNEAAAGSALDALRAEGLAIADTRRDEFPVRWVPIEERAVPTDADTIIRTLTRTLGPHTDRGTFWLEGLRGPRF